MQCRLAASNHALISASPRALKAASIIPPTERYDDDAGLAFWSVKNCQRPWRSFVNQKPLAADYDFDSILLLKSGGKWKKEGVGGCLTARENRALCRIINLCKCARQVLITKRSGSLLYFHSHFHFKLFSRFCLIHLGPRV